MNDISILRENGIDVDTGLSLLGDLTMYNDILKEFLNGYTERMKRMKQYLLNQDLVNYAIEVHSLKSDSKYLGFQKLAELSYQQELASKKKDNKICREHYQELLTEVTRVVEVSKKYLSSSTSASVILTNDNIKRINQKIVVADDSEIIRDFIKEIFEDQFEVLMAKDGKEVINIIATHKEVVALLLDLNMPNIDGFQVLDYFREKDLFQKVPVSIISGANDKESIEKAFTYDIVDMINKPFNKENVRHIVEKMLNISKEM